MAINLLFYKSDNVIEVLGLQNELSGEFLNSANVIATMVDQIDRTPLDGQPWPVALIYDGFGTGNYRATLQSTLVIQPGQYVIAQITANAGPGLTRYWEIPILVNAGST